MADVRTPKEVKARYLNKLGPELGPVFHALWNELAWLQEEWAEYQELFGKTPERVELLNSVAGFFFRVVQDTLWESILLYLTRLTDSPRTAGKSNLTIRALPELCTDPKLRNKVSELVDNAVEATEFARDWRNRRYAHTDLALALEPGAKPLEEASREKVSRALSSIHAVLSLISETLLGSTLAEFVIPEPTGACALLEALSNQASE